MAKKRSPKQWAAGAPAVAHALGYGLAQTSPARLARTLMTLNQPGGIDCPGCAWPEPSGHTHINEYCENGAKHVADEATSRRVSREFFASHTVDELAAMSDRDLNHLGRLTEPMIKRRGSDRYEPTTWGEALSVLSAELNALTDPNEAVFYTSGRVSNEAAFLFQLFARAFGTNNLPDCSNMCHESSGTALHETLGVGKGNVGLDDLHHADLIIVVGQNPGTNHPRMMSALETAKRNGAVIVAVNTLPEAGLIRFKNPQRPSGLIGRGTRITDQFLQIRAGGDLALFRALNLLLLEAEDSTPGAVLNHRFIAEHTSGYIEFARHARELKWGDVQAATGLQRSLLEQLLDRVLASERVIVCWAMGITQHPHAVATIREIVNFLILRGNLGNGSGVCPVRGHSNVQGDRTMGIWERVPQTFLDALHAEFGFEPPRAHGYDSVEAIRAMRDGRARVFVGLAGNFARAAPDTLATEAAMRRCRLTAHMSTKLNHSHAVTGEIALILPSLGRSDRDVQSGGEQFVTVEDSMSTVHQSRGKLRPASENLLSEPAFVCRLAQATLRGREQIPWADFEADYARIRESIARVVPGFDDFNARVARPGGFRLPNPVNTREFATSTGKACFTCNDFAMLSAPPGHLILQTLRSHDQWNTIPYTDNDRYRGIQDGRKIIMVNPEDLSALGLQAGDPVDIVSVWPDGQKRTAHGFQLVSYPTTRGCAACYYPETNVLVPLDSVAAGSNTPTSKAILVRLEPARP